MRLRTRLAIATVVAAGSALTVGAPAQAYTETKVSGGNKAPWLEFDKNPSAPLNSKLTAWVSVAGTRYRIEMRAGSGNGTTNDCASSAGWLPNGTYSQTDSDSASMLKHYNKTWGNATVRGWVWELGSKTCSRGTTRRTELFIHSQGTSGWQTRNYASAGCIKINQVDRSHLHARWQAAYQQDRGTLQVVS